MIKKSIRCDGIECLNPQMRTCMKLDQVLRLLTSYHTSISSAKEFKGSRPASGSLFLQNLAGDKTKPPPKSPNMGLCTPRMRGGPNVDHMKISDPPPDTQTKNHYLQIHFLTS